MGFPDDSDSKGSTRECRIHGFDPWVQEDPLKEEMATHSSILAWEIWWTEEPGGLQSMVSQRIRRDWVSTISDGWTPRKWSPNYWFSYICKAFYILVPNYPSNFTDDCRTTETPWISLTVLLALSRIHMLSFPHDFVHVIPHLLAILIL